MSGERRERARVRGVVQGVGFRPFLVTLAERHHLTGWVRNDSEGVIIEIEGGAPGIHAFFRALVDEAPVLARIESVDREQIEPQGSGVFEILASSTSAAPVTPVAPDVAMCDDCRRELRDPTDRRFRYPFINCTNCGPRFTIIRDLPYDRVSTTMSTFTMCEDCQAEYSDQHNRRFHAQPNACAACGPRLEWRTGTGHNGVTGEPALQHAIRLLREDGILAVKGIGGFHLACRATSVAAIRRLRERKGRVDKPFALMAPSIEVVRQFAIAGAEECTLLQAPERPIVVLGRRTDPELELPAEVAPGHHTIGVMLPYSPVHELLLDGEVLVMTSGNLGDEPIAWSNSDALDRLSALVDGFLLHNRDIEVFADDSVVRHVDGRVLPIRRSRGYAPYPVRLREDVAPVLAVGGELKATVCLTRDRYAFLSQHIGDLGNLETLDAMSRATRHLEQLFRVTPRAVICDEHPGYLSARWAEEAARARAIPLVRIQHHHAHAVALHTEHTLDADQPLLTFVFDGTGYGTDGAIWGGEVLRARPSGFERVAHLKYTRLPGGDAAIRRPARVALAQLHDAGVPWDPRLSPFAATSDEERRILSRQLETGLRCVRTSSMGRFLDALASIAGVRHAITYEGQAAIEFESRAIGHSDAEPYRFGLEAIPGEPLRFDGAPVILAAAEDAVRGVPPGVIAGRAHEAICRLVADVALRLATPGQRQIGLTGGVFQNVALLTGCVRALRAAGFDPLIHHQVPPNDGGLSLGQAVAGLARLGWGGTPG